MTAWTGTQNLSVTRWKAVCNASKSQQALFSGVDHLTYYHFTCFDSLTRKVPGLISWDRPHIQDSSVQYLEENLTGFSGKVAIHGMNETFPFYSSLLPSRLLLDIHPLPLPTPTRNTATFSDDYSHDLQEYKLNSACTHTVDFRTTYN
ncbi:uncharacterized protein [Desmodus rotundus]|uniref:uncharacterized protein n=1 Tax=Desmodus rotundus TaxID=9430 RepID=UPI002380F852|nr:uncharacterized protein LOC128780200 [Desmodus rotundus]